MATSEGLADVITEFIHGLEWQSIRSVRVYETGGSVNVFLSMCLSVFVEYSMSLVSKSL
jgi:hypothetical protein